MLLCLCCGLSPTRAARKEGIGPQKCVAPSSGRRTRRSAFLEVALVKDYLIFAIARATAIDWESPDSGFSPSAALTITATVGGPAPKTTRHYCPDIRS